MNKTKIISLGLLFVLLTWACGGGQSNDQTSSNEQSTTKEAGKDYDPKRGEGKFNVDNFKLSSIDEEMVKKGKEIANTKCFSCHRLNETKLVGPGWKGVTKRNEPFWIMNFIINPEPMIEKEPKLQAQLELCLVRMPNQNLSEDEARLVLEVMRKNDSE